MNAYEADQMDRHKQGHLTMRKTIKLFASLIRFGRAWGHDPFCSKQAKQFIDSGLISGDGVVNEQNLIEVIEGE